MTKDGARCEVVEERITGLVSAEKSESLWIGYALVSMVLKDDLKWLRQYLLNPGSVENRH